MHGCVAVPICGPWDGPFIVVLWIVLWACGLWRRFRQWEWDECHATWRCDTSPDSGWWWDWCTGWLQSRGSELGSINSYLVSVEARRERYVYIQSRCMDTRRHSIYIRSICNIGSWYTEKPDQVSIHADCQYYIDHLDYLRPHRKCSNKSNKTTPNASARCTEYDSTRCPKRII